ncbi:MAG: hypothetical protein PWP64_949, partial [Candidatus Cloacimonadota bacterium]|nr:hypothetical protein [Candidatus Cloacimonadota bacterium]
TTAYHLIPIDVELGDVESFLRHAI